MLKCPHIKDRVSCRYCIYNDMPTQEEPFCDDDTLCHYPDPVGLDGHFSMTDYECTKARQKVDKLDWMPADLMRKYLDGDEVKLIIEVQRRYLMKHPKK